MASPFQFRGHHDDGPPLLRQAQPARPLRVLLDERVWRRLQQGENASLHALLNSDQITTTAYGDDGPPADVPRRPSDTPWGGGEAIGWTVVTVTDDEMVPYQITTTTEKTVTSGALFADQVRMASMVLELEGGPADAHDALLIAVAQEIHADLIITERLALLDTELLDDGNCQAVSAADALPLIALYLRAGGTYILAKSANFTFTATPMRFYSRVAATYITALGEFVHRAEGHILAARILTLLSRSRTLFKARDHIALLISEPATEDNADEIALTFTHALVDMVALHDVLARIVNELLDPPETQSRQIKWQDTGWRTRAIDSFPGLDDPWSDDGYARHVNHALRVMRNEIHDVAPSIIPFKTKRGGTQVGLAFNVDVGTRVVASLNALNDARRAGIEQAFADGHLVNPHTFYEFVLPWVVRSVDDVLGALLLHLPERAPRQNSSGLSEEAIDESIRAIVPLPPR